MLISLLRLVKKILKHNFSEVVGCRGSVASEISYGHLFHYRKDGIRPKSNGCGYWGRRSSTLFADVINKWPFFENIPKSSEVNDSEKLFDGNPRKYHPKKKILFWKLFYSLGWLSIYSSLSLLQVSFKRLHSNDEATLLLWCSFSTNVPKSAV